MVECNSLELGADFLNSILRPTYACSMARSRAGSPIDKVREPHTCVDCGVSFDPGKGTVTKRCLTCREKWNRERPDRKKPKRPPEPCLDCGTMIEPTTKGRIAKRCPACRQRHDTALIREHRKAGRYVMNGNRGTQHGDLRCEGCGVGLERSERGPSARYCVGCRRERHNAAARDRYASRQADRPWLKEIRCVDCQAQIPPAPPGQRRPVRCDECRPKHKKPFLKDPAKQRDKHLRRMYGMTIGDYDRRSSAQGGRCAICGRVETPLHVDHDHETKEVRALLCQRCNRMIGMAHDRPATLRSAANYLEAHDASEIPEDEDREPSEPEDFEELEFDTEP